jgi:K+/H+ antiporter YhaU regulatory subunit KhtT
LGFLDLQSNQAQNRFYNEVEEKLSERTKFSLLNLDQDDKKNLAPAYIESLIEVTTENLKKSTSVIDKQNTHQESLAKSISEINNLISENIELNKNISEEIRVLSKTIANVNKKQ